MADDSQKVNVDSSVSGDCGTMQENGATAAPKKDQELDDLLDSALEDFDKPSAVSQANEEPPESTKQEDNSAVAMENQQALFEELFNSDPMSRQTQEQFQLNMQGLMGDGSGLVQQFDKLAKLAGEADATEESQKAFADTLQQTLNSLSDNADNIESEFNEDELMRAMAGMGLEGEAGEGDTSFITMMQGMMSSLLSKDVLYPSLKEISDKYPTWLEENKGKEPEESYNKYKKQYECMKKVCEEFEAENDTDSDNVKRERFERILEVMQSMQECGQPPKDLVGEMNPGAMEFDENGLPKLAGMPGLSQDQCCLM